MIGLPLGLLTASSKFMEDTIGVLALGLQTLPSVCWVPLALLWFGQTESAMLFVVIMGTVWSVVIATDTGVRNIPPIYARAARTMGSTRLHKWTRVILPASLPYLVSGMKQGWAFAWRSLMAAEIYVTILTGFGLGHLLHYGRELQCDGPGDRHHAGDRRDWIAGRQDLVLALGTFSSPALGNRKGVTDGRAQATLEEEKSGNPVYVGAGIRRGRAKVKIAPRPGLSRALIFPPWSSTILLQIERPRPVPWRLP